MSSRLRVVLGVSALLLGGALWLRPEAPPLSAGSGASGATAHERSSAPSATAPKRSSAPGETAPERSSARGEAAPGRTPAATTSYTRDASAYDARLWVDDEAAVLATGEALVVLRPGEPPEEHRLDLGAIAARQGTSIVFWRAGKLRRVSLSGELAADVAELPRAPQFLLASDGELAWVEVQRAGGTSLHVLSTNGPRQIHATADRATAAVLHGSSIYWVLQSRTGSWRIGRVSLDGQHATLTAGQRGRPPAMLAAGSDGIYFYAGPERGVRRLSLDLQREDAVLANVICSPLAVSSRVVCARVGGVFEVAPSGQAPRLLALEPVGPITALAATNDRAFWVVERGERRLSVESAALGAP